MTGNPLDLALNHQLKAMHYALVVLCQIYVCPTVPGVSATELAERAFKACLENMNKGITVEQYLAFDAEEKRKQILEARGKTV